MITNNCGSGSGNGDTTTKMAVVMVGLPGRHKTFTARSLARYLRWIGYQVAVLSVADLRRQHYGTNIRAAFFDPKSEESIKKRTVIADMALDKIINLLEEGNMQIVILDASNTTVHRREIITDRLKNYKTLFIECIGNDEQVAEDPSELGLEYPEYIGLPYDLVFNDFIKRIAYYKPHYVQLGYEQAVDREKSFVRIINGGSRIELHRVSGYISTKMVFFLMNLNPKERVIWLSCAQDDSVYEKISKLSLRLSSSNKESTVWISARPQYHSITNFFKNVKVQSSLNEQEMGIASNMSEEQLAESYPEEWSKYQKNPFKYRWHRAESHKDLAIRLENIIMQIFKYQGHLIIFADPTVLECIYGYFVEECWDWWSKISINNPSEIVEIRPRAYGSYESIINVENGQTIKEPKLRAHLELLHYY